MKHRRFLALLLVLCMAASCVFPAMAVETQKNPETAKVQNMLNARPVPGTAVPADTGDTVIAVGTVDVDTTLNVRSGPGTSYSKVGTLIGGQRVAFYETKTVGSTTWGRMDLGWISMAYVILDEDLEFTDAGYCGTGEEVLWGYAEDAQMLVIVGEGPMLDYPASASAEYMVPWLAYRSEIRTVLVDYGVTYVGNYAFLDSTALRFAYVSDTVTEMGDGTFTDCISLLDFYLPDTMTTVGGSTFRGCYNLVYAWLPAGLTALSSRMLEGCTALETVVMPTDVTVIGPDAFSDCTSLTEIALPEGLSTIGENAFNNCTGLESIELPTTVQYLKRGAFYNCIALNEVTFLGNAPVFGSDPFTGVVADVYYPANNFTWTETVRQNYGGTLTWHAIDIPGSANPTITGTCGDNLTWTLSEGVLTISGTGDMYDYNDSVEYGVAPWYNYKNAITQVILPDGITSIGAYAFYDAKGLSSIVIPDSVSEIGKRAFYGCSGLTSVTLPAGLTEIKERTFFYTSSLKEITIPAQVESIGVCAFDSSGLEKITFLGDAPSIGSGAFTGVAATAYYHVNNDTWTEDVMQNYSGTITWEPYGTPIPKGTCGDNLTWILEDGVLTVSGGGAMDDFDDSLNYNTAPWAEYADQITQVILEPGVTTIGDYAFYYCENLTAVSIPEGVTNIGSHAFYADDLRTVEVPGSVTAIEEQAFGGNWDLAQVVLHEGLVSIGEAAFINAGMLTELEIPETVTTIESEAFFDCNALTRIKLPSGLTEISSALFCSCDSLKEVTIPAGVTTIGDMAFFRCESLTELILPDALTTIGRYAFDQCTSLTSIVIPDGVTLIGSNSFTASGLQEITFLGDAPVFDDGHNSGFVGGVFYNLTVTAYYPYDNETWTEDVLQDYTGDVNWLPYRTNAESSVVYTSASLSMAGDIGLNYYVQLSDDIILDGGAYMQFTFGDQVQTIPLRRALPGDDGTCRFSCAIPAKRMTDVVTGQMYTSAGPVGEAKQYSVKQYCIRMKEHVEENGLTGYDSLLNMLDAMLNYGAHSQLIFGYNTDNLANADLSEEAKALPETLDVSAYAHSVTGSEEGITVHSASLLLESRTTIRFYFKLTGDRGIDDVALTVDGTPARLTQSGDLYYVDVPNVAAKELDTMHTVAFEGGLTVRYCGLSYVNQILGWSGATQNEINNAKALYLFNQTANAYFGS